MSGGSGGGTTTTVQKADPWSGVQPYLTNAYSTASNLYGNAANFPQYYPGQQVAPLTPAQNEAINNVVSYGSTPNPLIQTSQNALTDIASGSQVNSNPLNSMLAPYTSGQMLSGSNPYLANVEKTAAEQITPQVMSQFEGAGRYGSGAAANALASSLANMAGNLGYQNYQQGQANQLNAAGQVGQAYESGMGNQLNAAMLSPSLYSAPISGGQAAISAASIPQAQQQNEIQALMNKYNYNQQLPFTMNSQYLGALQGATPYASSSMTQPYFTNPTAGALGGALAGGMAGNALGTALGFTGPWGAVGGALLGGLLGG